MLDHARKAIMHGGRNLVAVGTASTGGGRREMDEDSTLILDGINTQVGHPKPCHQAIVKGTEIHKATSFVNKILVASIGYFPLLHEIASLSVLMTPFPSAVYSCGHWVQQERADETNAALLAFLTAHPLV
jgi:hypothetical protein